jgi:tetratricopeptide (TPR) repeat protein
LFDYYGKMKFKIMFLFFFLKSFLFLPPVDAVEEKTAIVPQSLITDLSYYRKTIDALQLVTNLLNVLVGLLVIVITLALALGIIEYIRGNKFRKKLAALSGELKAREKEATKLTRQIKEKYDQLEAIGRGIPFPSLKDGETEPATVMRQVDKFLRGIEILELLGFPLKQEDYVKRAAAFYFKDNYEEAIEALDKALEIKPDDAAALYSKGAALLNLNWYDEALKAFDKAINIRPGDANSWRGKGAALLNLDRYDEALKVFDKAIDIKPDVASSWRGKGAALLGLDRYDEALKAFDKAIDIKPDQATAWHAKGMSLRGLNRYDEALKSFDNAIAINPNYAVAWRGKGMTLRSLDRYDEALRAFDKTLGIDPGDAIAWYNSARIFALKEDRDKSLEYLSRAVQLDKTYKKDAKENDDFKTLWTDDDFKKLVE